MSLPPDQQKLFDDYYRYACQFAVNARIKQSAILGFDDIKQELLLGLWKAVRTWRPDRGTQFKSWLTMILRNQICNMIRASQRKGGAIEHEPLNDVMEECTAQDESDGRDLLDTLRPMDRHVARLAFGGLAKPNEIADMCHMERVAMQPKLQRIKEELCRSLGRR